MATSARTRVSSQAHRHAGDLRIESDGIGHGTMVFCGDQPVTNATSVTWSLPGATDVATATVTFELVDAALTAMSWERSRPTLRQRLRALWFVLRY